MVYENLEIGTRVFFIGAQILKPGYGTIRLRHTPVGTGQVGYMVEMDNGKIFNDIPADMFRSCDGSKTLGLFQVEAERQAIADMYDSCQIGTLQDISSTLERPEYHYSLN